MKTIALALLLLMLTSPSLPGRQTTAPADRASLSLPSDEARAAAALYTFQVTGPAGEGVGEVYLNACTDTACHLLVTDASGQASFEGEPFNYHVEVIRVPQGYRLPEASGLYTDLQGGLLTIHLAADEGE